MPPAPTALVQEQVWGLVPLVHTCGSDGVLAPFLLNSHSLCPSPGSTAQPQLPNHITFPRAGRIVTMTPSLRLSAHPWGTGQPPKPQGAEAKLCCCSGAQGNEGPMECWTSCIQGLSSTKAAELEQEMWKMHKPGEMRAQSLPLQPASHRHRAGHKGSTAFNCSSLTQPGTRAWEAPASPIAVRPVKLTPCLENCI